MAHTATSRFAVKRSSLPSQQGMPAALDMNRVGCIILGGGEGTRLFPLTASRCKPAICFGGRYRLIDIPISNAINSNCHKIFIVTQFLSSSLHRHIFQTYHLNNFSSGFIDILAAEQKPTTKAWFQGTADAVRQNLDHFIETPADYFLILSGDQLYNIDFREMFSFALKTDADLVIAALPVEETTAKRMGILKVDKNSTITDFHEKPQEKHILDQFKISQNALNQINPQSLSNKHNYLGSMGIYLFKREALFNLLENDSREDFGKHLIPSKVQQGNVSAYLYNGYWEDIGTIETFYNANIALTLTNPLFDCYNEQNPIYTSTQSLSGAKISGAQVTNSIICEGSIVEADEVSNSILGPRTVVKQGTLIRDSYIMGNDYYVPPIRNTNRLPENLHIGEQCIINRAIIDKNAWIGNRVQLINKNKLSYYNGDNIFIRDGIIVVMRGATIPDGFVL